MNQNREDPNDFDDILKNLVPYDEVEREPASTSTEDEEVFDMDAVEREYSIARANNLFSRTPSPSDVFTPSVDSSPQQQAQAAPEPKLQVAPAQEQKAHAQAVPKPQQESKPAPKQKVAPEPAPPVQEEELEEFVWEDNQLPAEWASPARSTTETSSNDNLTLEHYLQQQPTFDAIQPSSPVEAQMPAQEQNEQETPTSILTETPEQEQPESPVKHIANSPWHSSEESNTPPETQQDAEHQPLFRPLPDTFTTLQDNSWTLEECFSERENETNTEDEVLDNNYPVDAYSTDDYNSANISSTEGSQYFSREDTNIVNPESIPSGCSEAEESPEYRANHQLVESAQNESEDRSSIDELFKDCPPIDPSIFNYGINQQYIYSYNNTEPQQQQYEYNTEPVMEQYNTEPVAYESQQQYNTEPVMEQPQLYQYNTAQQNQYNTQPVMEQYNTQPQQTLQSVMEQYNTEPLMQQPVSYELEQAQIQQNIYEANNPNQSEQIYAQPLPQGRQRPAVNIPATPFQYSAPAPAPDSPYAYALPSTAAQPLPLETVKEPENTVTKIEGSESWPSSAVQLAFCNGFLVVTSSTPSVTNSNKLLPNPMKTTALEVPINTVSIKHKSNQDLINTLIDILPGQYTRNTHPLNYLLTKNSTSISSQEPVRTSPVPIRECIQELPQDINTVLLENNWAEGFFLASSDETVLSTVQFYYTQKSTNSITDHIYLLLRSNCNVPKLLFDSPEVLAQYTYILKGIVKYNRTESASLLIESLFRHNLVTEAMISIVLSGVLDENIDKVYDINTLLIYNKLRPENQEKIANRVKDLIKNIKTINPGKATEIYKENKDIFNRVDRKTLEDALGIEGSSWGIQGIINAVDKGITRMVSTPLPVTPQATSSMPAEEQPVMPSMPAQNIYVKRRTPAANRPVGVFKSAEEGPKPEEPKVLMGNPATSMPMPAVKAAQPAQPSRSMPMPQMPKITKASQPAQPSRAMPMPAMPMPAVNTAPTAAPVAPASTFKPGQFTMESLAANNPNAAQKISPIPPMPLAAPEKTEQVDEDSIDYRALYSDKSRYQLLDPNPDKGSWLGSLPGVSTIAQIARRFSRKSDIPVIELSQDTTFVYDKKMKKWITVDAKTLRPIKLEVTQSHADDKETGSAPKPMPMPVITGKMPKRGPDGKVDFGPVGTSLEARYGKPMIEQYVDRTTEADIPAMFPRPKNIYTRENTKIFVPKFPVPEDEAGH